MAVMPVVPFLHPSKVSVRRPVADDGVGARPYSGLSRDAEVVVASDLPAHIQLERQGKLPPANLPADSAGQPLWRIVIPNMPRDGVLARDVLVDGSGRRFQVYAAQWNPLSTSCTALELQN